MHYQFILVSQGVLILLQVSSQNIYVVIYVTCDSDVAYIDCELQAKRGDKFLCFILKELQIISISLQPWFGSKSSILNEQVV